MTDQQPSLRDLRFMRLMIDVVGGERHTVSLRQLEEWLDRMVERPITAKGGYRAQLVKTQNPKGEDTFSLSAIE